MKLLSVFLVLILALTINFTHITFAQENETEKVDVYALFWPIVPGKTVGDSMFWAKQLKEGFSGMFVFGNVSKSGFQIELAEKRLVEANKLFEDKKYDNGFKSLDLNKAARDQAVSAKKKAIEEKKDVVELTNKLVKSLEKQEKAIKYMMTQVPEEQKGKIDEILKELTLQISEAK